MKLCCCLFIYIFFLFGTFSPCLQIRISSSRNAYQTLAAMSHCAFRMRNIDHLKSNYLLKFSLDTVYRNTGILKLTFHWIYDSKTNPTKNQEKTNTIAKWKYAWFVLLSTIFIKENDFFLLKKKRKLVFFVHFWNHTKLSLCA